jgi:phasin family protein
VPYPPPGEIAISLAERNMTVAFEFARKLARAKNLQEAIALQAEFMRTQVELASEFMRELTPKK